MDEKRSAKSKSTATGASKDKAGQGRTTGVSPESEFLGRLGHELRNPLTGLLGFLRMAADKDDSTQKDREEYISQALRSGESLLDLVDNLLELARLESGQAILEETEMDVRSMMADVATTFASQAHGKGVEIDFLTDPALPAVLIGDNVRLRQVFFNLTGNAVKFTSAGSVLMRADVLASTKNSHTLRYSVQDTGPGISKAQQSRIFENYVSGDSHESGSEGGLGLGLAICKQIMEHMGGSIQLDESSPLGSTFSVTVKLPAPPKKGRAAAKPPGPNLKKVPILLVDPRPSILEIYREKLAQLGAAPETAPSRKEALQLLEKGWQKGKPFKVVLATHNLEPDKLADFAREIRSHRESYQPDLVLLSLSGQEGENWYANCGFNSLLTLPAAPEKMQEILGSLVARQSSSGAPLSPIEPSQDPFPNVRKISGEVLVVEDNIVNQKLVTALLAKEGYIITVASNGKEALEIFDTRPFDLVLMDIQMPVMDGLTATREIRNHARGKTIPIIAMTAATLRGDREKCDAAGMNDYIGKPIMPGLLQEILEKWSGKNPDDKTVETPQAISEAALAALDEAHLESVQSFADSHPPAVFSKWVQAFLDDLGQCEDQLTRGRETEDWSLATQAARQLMLDCGGFGAPRLRELAREIVTELERNGEADTGERFDALAPRMKRECEALREVLERRIGNGG